MANAQPLIKAANDGHWQSLQNYTQERGTPSLAEAFQISKAILEELARYHSQGKVYGQLSPHTVQINADQNIRLQAIKDLNPAEQGRLISENPDHKLYLAPEFWREQPLEPGSDIYSAALLLYFLLTGNQPKVQEQSLDLSLILEALDGQPKHLQASLAKALAAKPSERFQSSEQFFFALINQDAGAAVDDSKSSGNKLPELSVVSVAEKGKATQDEEVNNQRQSVLFLAKKWLISHLKKSWILIFTCLLIISMSWVTLFKHYASWETEDLVYIVESTILDWKFRQRGELKTETPVGVLAIDERSLTEFGRWPFSRRYYAQAFDNLKKLGVKWIGFDSVWAEPEKALLEDGQAELERIKRGEVKKPLASLEQMLEASSSDRVFVESVRRFENVVMGYFFFASEYEAQLNVGHRDPFMGLEPMIGSEIMLYDIPQGMTLDDYPFLTTAYGVVANTPFHSSASDHFAFFSNDADDDAINRWVMLLAKIDGHLMPSLSLKTAAEYLNREIFVFFDSVGVETIALVNREDESDVIEIPTDPKGRARLLLNHRGPNRAFKHFSLVDAYNNSFSEEEKKALDGAVLLLGATAIGMNDMRPNPFDATVDGVENHAAAIDNIIQGNFMKRPADIYEIELYIVLGIGLIFGPLMIWGPAMLSGLAMLVFLVGYYYFDHYVWFENGIWTYMAIPYLEILSMFTLTTLIKYISEEKDKKFLKSAFGSYISPELIDEMYSSGEPPKLGGTSGILSAYFTDIQGFSSFSEKLTAPQLVELLNEYLTAMTDILLEHKGTLDKYEGDAIIAFFGAPMKLPDHARRAVTVAVRMQEKLLELRQKWVEEGDKWPDIVKEMRMRIGINSGEIVTGNMGSRDRMNYTMMGDSVNLAARLEEAAKQYGIFTQISSMTRELAGPEHFELRELDTIRVVGKTEPVTTYDVLGVAGETSQDLIALKEHFHKALALYKNQQWDAAIAGFETSLEYEYKRYPDLKGKKTNPSLVYIERCKAFKENPPPADWDCVYTLTSK